MANALNTSVCEFRATAGDNTNGGFFDTASGGTDYSNQDNPQLTLTDLATDVAGTGLSSATGGFTAAMVGNSIYISSGTGFTVGWYRVTAYTDTNNVTIDRSAGASATVGSGKLGGALALLTDAFLETEVVAGMSVYIKNDGAMTLTASVNVLKDGNSSSAGGHINIKGYNLVRGDSPAGNNRPVIACGANDFIVNNYWSFFDLRMTGTGSYVLKGDDYCKFLNLKNENTSATAGRSAIFASTFSGTSFIGCEAVSTNGTALFFKNSNAINCYVHDSDKGFDWGSGKFHVLSGCVADTCRYGLYDGGSASSTIINNTFYNCSTYGIRGYGLNSSIIVNNIFDNCGDGINESSGDRSKTNFVDYNNYSNNTNDVVNVTKGAHATALAPQFADAANGDFSVGENMKAKAWSGSFVDYIAYMDLGGVQRVEPAAGGGGEKSNVNVN